VGIHNRFDGQWLGPSEPGWGRLAWLGGSSSSPPVLRVRDKGRLEPGQRVSWVLPGDAVTLDGAAEQAAGEQDGSFEADVRQARHLGEITLADLAILACGAQLHLVLTGAARARLRSGERVRVRVDLEWVHVMPTREGSQR
jgi:molybdate transport system ATP-binding protein